MTVDELIAALQAVKKREAVVYVGGDRGIPVPASEVYVINTGDVYVF